MIKYFDRICSNQECRRKFQCENSCGCVGKYPNTHCQCKKCHAETIGETGHSCEERVVNQQKATREKVQFT